jgi:hypothetical protein
MNENIFNVFVQKGSKKRLVTLEGKIFEIANEIDAPKLEESEFINVASLFQKPDLSFLQEKMPKSILDERALNTLLTNISNSNFFKAYKGGKNLGKVQPNDEEATLWIFNDVLTSTWTAKGDQEIDGFVNKVLAF